MLGVNTDEDPDDYRRECAAEGVRWPSVFAGSRDAEPCRAFGVEGFPETFVLDARGVLRAKGLRGAELEACVDELVRELCRAR